jgi:CHAD domain-containing protein
MSKGPRTIEFKKTVHRERPRRAKLTESSVAPSALGHVRRSLQKQWKRYRKDLKRCQRKFSEKAVHDSRVAARRLSATIDLMEGFLRPELVSEAQDLIKEHLDIFDDLRDAQVQLVAVNSLQGTFPASRALCEWLEKREKRFRKQTCDCVKRSKTKPLGKLIAASEDAFKKELKERSAKDATNLLLRVVNKAFGRTMRLKQRIRTEQPKSIHRTRVAFKRFRYMVELLADYLAADDKMLAEMQHYQTMMGDIQDAQVLLQCFDKFARKKNIRSEQANQLREELLRRREWLIQVYMDAGRQLREFWPIEGSKRHL